MLFWWKQSIRGYKLIIFFIVLSVLFSLVIIKLASRKINPTLYRYANIEVSRLTNNIVTYQTKKILSNKNLENIFTVDKNASNEIEELNFNTKKVNSLLNEVTDQITKQVIAIEEGNIDNIALPATLRGEKYHHLSKGIVCEIPIGILFDSDILSNLGTNIPIKLVFSGKANSYIDTDIKEYGINNAYIAVNLIIKLHGRIVMPTTSKETVIKSKIPLVIKIVNGKIPAYYLKGT